MNETAKNFLRGYIKSNNKIIMMMDEVRALYSKLEVGSIPFDKDGSSNPNSGKDNRTHLHVEIVDIKNEIECEKRECIRTMHDVLKTIRMLDSKNEQTLLKLRYIDGKSFEEISDKMGYSVQHVHRIHSNALINITNLIKDESKC